MSQTTAATKTGPELSVRSIVVGLVVAVLIGSAYPYCVLKLGFGPNLSVVSAFFGFIALVLILRAAGTNARENNIVQTMGTSAGQTAFMCVLLAAFDLLNAKGVLNPPIHLGTWQIFFWLCSASLLGILLAVPMRRHYIDEENLTYADGLAAGETIKVLHEGRETGVSSGPLQALGLGTFASGALMAVTTYFKWIRDTWFLPGMQPMNIGFNFSLLSFGSGLLVGFRICLSMAIGTTISWFILPPFLLRHGMIPAQTFPLTLRWVMWPATGLMVAGGLTSLLLKWNLIVKTFRGLRGSQLERNDFPMQWVVIGSLVMTVVICLVQYFSMGIPVYLSFIAILLSLPLMLVGLRVLGETNWGPISALSNMMQGIFGVLAPGQIIANMLASGTTGTIATESEALMQDYKAGDMIGSSPKNLTIMQLIATPIGAAAVSWMYPLLRDTYGIVGNNAGLSSPISRKWAGFAEILSRGLTALPPGAVGALIVASLLGIAFAILENRGARWVPSPTAVGIGMLVPAAVILVMFLGSVVERIWWRTDRKTNGLYMVPLASGLIAGEAIVAVIIPLLVVLGIGR